MRETEGLCVLSVSRILDFHKNGIFAYMKLFSLTKLLKVTSVILALALTGACAHNEVPDAPDVPDTPDTPAVDTKAPVIKVTIPDINVIDGLEVTIGDGELSIGSQVVATWADETTKKCKAEISVGGKSVSSGSILSEAGTLILSVDDDAGNTATAQVILTIVDSGAPEISVGIPQKNVVAGVVVTVTDNQLLFDDAVAASWSDDYTAECRLEMVFTPADGSPKTINSGDVLSEAGTLEITVTDDFDNKTSVEITLTAVAVFCIESLQNLSIKVDEEVDLLQGITITEGLTLQKVECVQDGQRITIPNPNAFVQEYPATIGIILTLTRTDGKTIEVIADGLTVKPLDYNAPSLVVANMIEERFPWFTNRAIQTKEFVYGHLLVSYIYSERYWIDNVEYIIAGETTQEIESENVGWDNPFEQSTHADQGYNAIRTIAPFSTIKSCGGSWSYLESYINQHPERVFFVSCAADALGEYLPEELYGNPDYTALKNLLNKENVIISVASANISDYFQRIINESSPPQEGGFYSSASVNSRMNNKITVVGYDAKENHIFLDDCTSLLPVGFGKGNFIMPFIPLSRPDKEIAGSDSSFPTATLSGTLGNYLSIMISHHSGYTAEDAMTVITERYLREDVYRYKDTDGQIKDGGKWYFFDTDKFLKDEVLHREAVEAVLSGIDQEDIELPSTCGLTYEGAGIRFTTEGETYDMTEENRAALEDAVKSGNEVTWLYSPLRARKYGISGNHTIAVSVMDKAGNLVPDVTLDLSI